MAEHSEVTAGTLHEIRTAKSFTQDEVGAVIGLKGYHISQIESGRRNLSEAEKRLLDLYFFGTIPPGTVRQPGDLGNTLDFTTDEWRVIEILARRAGQTPPEWIRTKVLDYLAFSFEGRTELSGQPIAETLTLAAENPGKYQAGRGVSGKASSPTFGPPKDAGRTKTA